MSQTSPSTSRRGVKLINNHVLMAEWDWKKNKALNPTELTSGSNKVAWWRCSKGHEFESIISNRCRKGYGCPYCSGRRLSPENTLLAKYPEIAADWHKERNVLGPGDYSFASNKSVWWRCRLGHEYQTKINNRTSGGTNCPFCSGNRTTVERSLSVLNPQIAAQWCHERNKQDLSTVAAFSNAKVWWMCAHGHAYRARVADRTRSSHGCPYCSNHRVSETNNVAAVYPELTREWDDQKNGALKPSNLLPGSPRKVWWKCADGHSFQMAVAKRCRRGDGCPYCSGQRLTPEKSLQTLYPLVASEWSEKNARTPLDYHGHSNDTVWWKCKRGHEYQAQINNRTSGGTSCPQCNYQSSRGELRIFCELKHYFPDALSRTKVEGAEVDILLPSIRIAVEYDGYYFHTRRQDQDLKKNQKLIKNGFIPIRVRENPLAKLSHLDVLMHGKTLQKGDLIRLLEAVVQSCRDQEASDALLDYRRKKGFLNQALYEQRLVLLSQRAPELSLVTKYPGIDRFWSSLNTLDPAFIYPGSIQEAHWLCDHGHNFTMPVATAARNYARRGSFCPMCSGRRVTDESSLGSIFPQIAREWHPTMNGDLTPSLVTAGSSRKVWWRCMNGHEYECVIHKRTKAGQGCPYCSGRRVSKENSLLVRFPDIASQWDPLRNGDLTPSDVTYGSGKYIWWQCSQRHTWRATVSNRTNPSVRAGCPHCATSRRP